MWSGSGEEPWQKEELVNARSLMAAAAVAALSMSLAACGGDGDGGGKESFDLTIGDSIPLTGDLADFGPAGDKAAKVAVSQINKAIKADGLDQTVKLVTEDNETNPQAAVSAARKMVADGAGCIAGAWASADTIPTARSVAIPDGVLLISPASTSTEITGLDDDGLVNRTPPADNLQGAALASFVERQLGGAKGKTVSVAGRNDAYGEGLTDSFSAEWKDKGGDVSGPLLYDPAQATFNSEAQKIVAGNPDAYVIVDFTDTFPKVGPALVRTGKWDPGKTFVTDGLANSTFVEENVDITNGMRATAPGTPAQGPASQAFGKLYESSAPQDVARQTFDGQNFDAVILCYLAAVAAGSTDGEDMAAELRDLTGPPGTQYSWQQLPQAVKALEDGDDIDYLGASGEIDLDENGDPTLGVYDQLKFNNGEIAPFGPQVPLPSIQAVTGTD
jgi:ABC-type branched-subunit amino acid transport system substrate-binding protein